MKVLFVCNSNVARSQVARVCFDQLSQHNSDSAGLAVAEQMARRDLSSRKLKDFSPAGRFVESIRKAFGMDISDRERQQLTPEMVHAVDLVILVVEKDKWPDYLQEGGKVVFWDIPDPYRQDDDFVNDVYRQVQYRVEQLVKEIG